MDAGVAGGGAGGGGGVHDRGGNARGPRGLQPLHAEQHAVVRTWRPHAAGLRHLTQVSMSKTLLCNCFLSLLTSQGRDRSVCLKHSSLKKFFIPSLLTSHGWGISVCLKPSSLTASFLFSLHRGRDRSVCLEPSSLTIFFFSSHFSWVGHVSLSKTLFFNCFFSLLTSQGA